MLSLTKERVNPAINKMQIAKVDLVFIGIYNCICNCVIKTDFLIRVISRFINSIGNVVIASFVEYVLHLK